tara:strand:- start:1920 stop:2432 length:513 start_codon:yes stop_codon:yes gene_type:complete
MADLQFIKEYEVTSTVSEILCTDAFIFGYDVYAVLITKADYTVQTYSYLRLLDSSNNSIGDTEYAFAQMDLSASSSSFSNSKSDSATGWGNIDIAGTDDDMALGHIFYIIGAEDSTSYTFGQGQSAAYTSVGYGTKWIGVHRNAEQIKGFRYYRGSGDINSAKIQVYGVK